MGGFSSLKAGPTSKKDVLSCLLKVQSGYYKIEHDDQTKTVRVFDFELAPSFLVSVGFMMDGSDSNGDFGRPIFLHKKMKYDYIGQSEDILKNKELLEFLPKTRGVLHPSFGLLCLLRAHELFLSGMSPEDASEKSLNEHNSSLQLIQAQKAGLI